MDDWPQPFSQLLDAIATEAEQLFQAVVKETAEAVEQFVQVSEAIANQVEQTLAPEIDLLIDQLDQAMDPLDEIITPALEAVADQIDEVVDPLFEALFGDFETTSIPFDPPLDQTEDFQTEDPLFEDPMFEDFLFGGPPTCISCRNYYGHVYGGNRLICAIHPYGPEGVECPDWESTQQQDK